MSELEKRIIGEKFLCPNCGKRVYVKIVKRKFEKEIRREKFEYIGREAICVECGENVPVKEFDEDRDLSLTKKYCKKYDLIITGEIEKIIEVYDADKRQLPFLINVGEHTIERYLKGQIPNEKISAMLKSFLVDYKNFKKMYIENKDDSRVTDNTRRKVSLALERIEKLNSSRTKIEAIALYIINAGYEVTNLALQKLLYYADAVSLVKNNKPLFDTDCEAWVHGPVYPIIYNKYKCFGREQIYDCDLDKSYIEKISNEDKDILNYVLDNFAIYNGKVLERSTHRESPWLEVREGYFEEEISNEIIQKEKIKNYFKGIEPDFNLLQPDSVEKYIKQVV